MKYANTYVMYIPILLLLASCSSPESRLSACLESPAIDKAFANWTGFEGYSNTNYSKEDYCWLILAVQSNDKNLCKSIKNSEFMDDCYLSYAIDKVDNATCASIISVKKTQTCVRTVMAKTILKAP